MHIRQAVLVEFLKKKKVHLKSKEVTQVTIK